MAKDKRTYPYTAWTLLPSFKPKQIQLVRKTWEFSYPEYDSSESGKSYHVRDLFATKEAAIAEGRKRIETLEADLEKRRISIDKRRVALINAANSPT